MSIQTAKTIQAKYDVLHHQKRIQELANCHSHFDKRLLAESKAIVANPCTGYRSVDLSNTAYLAELDAFKSSINKQHNSKGNTNDERIPNSAKRITR
ncbi:MULTISPECIES: hypothetical protein [Vibrionaceae]|uniref:Uncharacterized protein n=1 Tax=Vibrio coralliilyticus TaxID=190893 RepID=A0AAP6ZTT6_9VIBR|nr:MULTISPECIES: hypothetical protein [Vibrionaceae]NOI32012.1 hypothetical protein [Vibrio coralliilyticus]NOJ25213.1 hypothetical protein [Vibrio coralliilyticus]